MCVAKKVCFVDEFLFVSELIEKPIESRKKIVTCDRDENPERETNLESANACSDDTIVEKTNFSTYALFFCARYIDILNRTRSARSREVGQKIKMAD